jgi:hypothetical protein
MWQSQTSSWVVWNDGHKESIQSQSLRRYARLADVFVRFHKVPAVLLVALNECLRCVALELHGTRLRDA